MRVHADLLVGSYVKQAARGVVGAGGEHVAVWKEGDRVYVGLVAGKRLLAQALAYVPQLGGRVTSTRHKRFKVGRQRQRHDVARVTLKADYLLPSLNIPQRTNQNQNILT